MTLHNMISSCNQRYGAIAHLLLFKASWLLLVIGQENWLFAAVILQVICMLALPGLPASLIPALQIGLLGICIDKLLMLAGILHFSTDSLPAWLLILWLAFALLLVRWSHLCTRLSLIQAACAGAVLGPFSYWLGTAFAAVEFADKPLLSLMIIMMSWSMMMPIFVKILRHPASPFRKILLLVFITVLPNASTPAYANDQLVGEATFKVFWRPIYDAYLYADNADFRFSQGESFILSLHYRMSLSKETIINETLKQWQFQNIAVSENWQQQLTALIPDISQGDQLSLHVDDSGQGYLNLNDELFGNIPDTRFTRAFAGIWLSENSAFPSFHKQLMGQP